MKCAICELDAIEIVTPDGEDEAVCAECAQSFLHGLHLAMEEVQQRPLAPKVSPLRRWSPFAGFALAASLAFVVVGPVVIQRYLTPPPAPAAPVATTLRPKGGPVPLDVLRLSGERGDAPALELVRLPDGARNGGDRGVERTRVVPILWLPEKTEIYIYWREADGSFAAMLPRQGEPPPVASGEFVPMRGENPLAISLSAEEARNFELRVVLAAPGAEGTAAKDAAQRGETGAGFTVLRARY